MPAHLFIIGLRRSGTTAFWQAFRNDPAFRALNEPFNPGLPNIRDPAWEWIGAYSEYRQLYLEDPVGFMHRFRPVYGIEELRRGLTGGQARYLSSLLDTAETVAINFTRCWFKLPALSRLCPSAVIVHLHRPPEAWASSIMLPSIARGPRMRLRKAWVRMSPWGRHRAFWGYQELIDKPWTTPFAEMLPNVGLTPDAVFALPTVGQLLAYWKLAYETVESFGRNVSSRRFLSVNFHDFCRAPTAVVRSVYDALDLPLPSLDLSYVRPPHLAVRAEHPRWRRYRTQLDLPALR